MGVESDQMVFDYLSRIGDLAQTALPASQRMRLVAQLRTDIDRERKDSDNPATVRRILGRIGSPDAVVEAAAGGSGDASSGAAAGPGVPVPPSSPSAPTGGPYGPYGVPSSRKAAGTDKGATGKGARKADWWDRDERRDGHLRAGDELTGLPGMTGGVFIPFDDEDLDGDADTRAKARVRPGAPRAPVEEEAEEAEGEAEYEEEAAARPRRRWLPRRRAARTVTWGSPLLLLAAALLVAGAVIGSWIPLGLGWLAGYLSRRLTRRQAKFGVLGIPGAAALGLVVWVWGRDTGKWGDPIAQGQMGHAFQDAYPFAVRVAAVGSALYLILRARRPL
ncbi:hypothetical protein [Streptomyces sp. CBMA29]|uniref:hypothetical protein n=1 Tax=Streptomyces sp. CBMA29 TaxID=1896314 RepID=UPI0016621919|nr:hypothetical protein [Streptomyces sp. CBMA29]MBD0734686.1 hypothetical protein [Streptomyces sp. CBMA29]